jgi:hypothetical protein
MTKTFTIHRLPACTDWKGNEYPDRFGVSLKDRRGRRWDGGEYATRDDAIAAGHAKAGAFQ